MASVSKKNLSPRRFMAFARERLESGEEGWQLLLVDDPKCLIGVDPEDVANPGRYELRHGDAVHAVCIVRDGTAVAVPGMRDPSTILAANTSRTTSSTQEALIQGHYFTQSQYEKAIARCDRLQQENEQLRNEIHGLKDEIRNMTLEKSDETKEMQYLQVGLQAVQMFLNSNFRAEFRERLQIAFKKDRLSPDQKEIAIALFNMDEFRVPKELAEEAAAAVDDDGEGAVQ